MPNIRFDGYYRYQELVHILHEYADEYPHLVHLESLGRSYEGREIWLAVVTSTATGSDSRKPALWVDGNLHASELAPSTCCLRLIHTLVTRYGIDPQVTRCLDTRAFYICPRVNPDGAEWALADRPRIVRSSTRPYPYDEEPPPGLIAEDIDGDGRILMMRIPDPNGAWKVCPEEPRLLVRREPAEVGGQYYRVLTEGRIEGYDGALIRVPRSQQGLDLNRNFPVRWRQEHEQAGAGPYPASEPEVGSVVRFIVEHPNITGGVAFHTYGGLFLRPNSDLPDTSFPAEDLWTYQKIGAKGTEITGYPNISIYHDFLYHPNSVTTGGFSDWLYDQMGVFAWGVELWSPKRQAGIDDRRHIDWYREHPLEDELKLLRWNDEALEGRGYVAWYPYDHPQLGAVELGGWDTLHVLTNPPPAFLEREIAPFADWLVWFLLISPLLEVYEARVTPLGEDLYRVRLVVQNTGWLPTYVTKKALEKKLVRGVVYEIALPADAELVSGLRRVELGQLEGRAYKSSCPIVFAARWGCIRSHG